ncbi:unnamed protein product [Phytophthora lilii]|uniref:Unnamed protein product n=1 Tax=Phytophthora lilii TaxID=2077276 RepID=A0A9W6XEQ4_9STRA|nr:unnamed protein product [Phytophthora lilii]
MDFLEATSSLRDIDHILRNINDVLARAKKRIHHSQSPAKYSAIQDFPDLLTFAMLIWEKDNTIVEASGIRGSAHVMKRGLSNVHPEKVHTTPATNCPVELFGNSWRANVAKAGDLLRVKVSDVRPADQCQHSKRKYGGIQSPSNSANEIINEMSKAERLRYLRCALQVLHIAEFLVLVELTEVIIPLVYCKSLRVLFSCPTMLTCCFLGAYLSIVYRLPNKVYYSQLRGVDDATLRRNLLSVMTYSLLELASFVLFSYFLQRKVEISSFR